jgi:hypothetical protein
MFPKPSRIRGHRHISHVGNPGRAPSPIPNPYALIPSFYFDRAGAAGCSAVDGGTTPCMRKYVVIVP